MSSVSSCFTRACLPFFLTLNEDIYIFTISDVFLSVHIAPFSGIRRHLLSQVSFHSVLKAPSPAGRPLSFLGSPSLPFLFCFEHLDLIISFDSKMSSLVILFLSIASHIRWSLLYFPSPFDLIHFSTLYQRPLCDHTIFAFPSSSSSSSPLHVLSHSFNSFGASTSIRPSSQSLSTVRLKQIKIKHPAGSTHH